MKNINPFLWPLIFTVYWIMFFFILKWMVNYLGGVPDVPGLIMGSLLVTMISGAITKLITLNE